MAARLAPRLRNSPLGVMGGLAAATAERMADPRRVACSEAASPDVREVSYTPMGFIGVKAGWQDVEAAGRPMS